jgi:hypothetical protein
MTITRIGAHCHKIFGHISAGSWIHAEQSQQIPMTILQKVNFKKDFWLTGNRRDLGIYGGSCEHAITVQVQGNTLEQMLEVENAVTAPLENFDLVVEAFDKTTVLSMDEIVRDFLPPSIEQFQERIKTLQTTFLNLLDPASDFGLRLFLG